MKKFVYSLLLLAVLAVPGLAGDIQVPGKTCTENCTNSATTTGTDASSIPEIFIAVLIELIAIP